MASDAVPGTPARPRCSAETPLGAASSSGSSRRDNSIADDVSRPGADIPGSSRDAEIDGLHTAGGPRSADFPAAAVRPAARGPASRRAMRRENVSAARSAVGEFGRPRGSHKPEIAGSNPACATDVIAMTRCRPSRAASRRAVRRGLGPARPARSVGGTVVHTAVPPTERCPRGPTGQDTGLRSRRVQVRVLPRVPSRGILRTGGAARPAGCVRSAGRRRAARSRPGDGGAARHPAAGEGPGRCAVWKGPECPKMRTGRCGRLLSSPSTPARRSRGRYWD